MTRTAMIRARITPEVKFNTEKILGKLGLSVSEAISMFCHQIALRKGLPFDVKVPNAKTLAAIEDSFKGRNLKRYKSLKEFKSAY